jgi:hypothetical protein
VKSQGECESLARKRGHTVYSFNPSDTNCATRAFWDKTEPDPTNDDWMCYRDPQKSRHAPVRAKPTKPAAKKPAAKPKGKVPAKFAKRKEL